MRVQWPRLALEPDDADPAWASQVQHASPKHSAIPRARTWQLTENGHATTWVQSRSCFTGAWISAWRCSARCWPGPVPGHRLVDACLRPGVNQSDHYSKKMLRPDADRLAGVCHGYAGRQLDAPLPRPVNQAFLLDTALEAGCVAHELTEGGGPGVWPDAAAGPVAHEAAEHAAGYARMPAQLFRPEVCSSAHLRHCSTDAAS